MIFRPKSFNLQPKYLDLCQNTELKHEILQSTES